jgi:RNA polymerase sigma-70 factor (ECF subfamily)
MGELDETVIEDERLELIFTCCHRVSGPPTRIDLAGEAIRLGRVLAALMPDEPEVHGLLALIHHARREARFSGDELVLLEDQDRSLWGFQEIATAREAHERAITLRGRGPYLLQLDARGAAAPARPDQ